MRSSTIWAYSLALIGSLSLSCWSRLFDCSWSVGFFESLIHNSDVICQASCVIRLYRSFYSAWKDPENGIV